MRVDLGSANVGMAHEFLDRANVIAALQEMRGEAVAQRVRTDRLRDGRSAGRASDLALHGGFVQVVAPDDAQLRPKQRHSAFARTVARSLAPLPFRTVT